MYRYKLKMLSLLGIKSPLEKSILDKIDSLTNDGMVDLMKHQYERYQKVTHFTKPDSIWKSWLRR